MEAPIAVVLAAGKGTRMKSELPKVLCQANGRPLVAYVIDSLQEAGVSRFVVVVGYRAELVEQELADYESTQFALQSEQLGTGHAVMMCREPLADHDGPLVMVAGDSPMLQASSIKSLLQEFDKTRPACILGTLIHDDPTGLGRIVRDERGKLSVNRRTQRRDGSATGDSRSQHEHLCIRLSENARCAGRTHQ